MPIYLNAKIGMRANSTRRHPNKNTRARGEKGFIGGYKTSDKIKVGDTITILAQYHDHHRIITAKVIGVESMGKYNGFTDENKKINYIEVSGERTVLGWQELIGVKTQSGFYISH